MVGRTAETAFNAVLAQALDQRHPRWDVTAEQTQVLAGEGERGKQPDIVITPQGRAGEPVVIETEYEPARTVDADAASRLGSVLEHSDHTIEKVVAVSIPESLRTLSSADLPAGIAGAEFDYRLLQCDASAETRENNAPGGGSGANPLPRGGLDHRDRR